jgi:hypothetical protein
MQVALAAQVSVQSPSHLASQRTESRQVIVERRPRFSLQSAERSHVATLSSPDLRSHVVLSVQRIELRSPARPLQSALPLHVSVIAAVPSALHFDEPSQLTEHADAPQRVTQSSPAVHVQTLPAAHRQPAPLQVAVGGGGASLPQAATSTPSAAAIATTANVVEARARTRASTCLSLTPTVPSFITAPSISTSAVPPSRAPA